VTRENLQQILDLTYTAVLRDDGTYLDKKGTLQWFLSNYAITQFVFSVNKHLLRFNVTADNLLTPDSDCFLPSISNNNQISFPLEKVMRWTYEVCETSHKNFHYPDKSSRVANHEQQEQNLDSAENWLNGKNLPSLSSLLWNFNCSFDALEKCEDPKFKRIISEKQRESICIALFIARASTYIFKSILDNYGLPYLVEICDQYRCYSNYLSEEILDFKIGIETHIAGQEFSPSQIDEVWLYETSEYFHHLTTKREHVINIFKNSTEENNPINLGKLEIENKLVQQFGPWTVLPIIKCYDRQPSRFIPERFPEFLFRGLALKDDTQATEEQIEKFSLELRQSGMDYFLPWILPWAKAAFHYRKKQDDISFSFTKEAFNSAKYCAGNKQYKLVNQFIELAAKNNKWSEFKRGVHWAQYLGIEVRWLRKDEPNEKNLRSVFRIMKKVRYYAL
jgi:hypothetical protein